MLPLLLVALLLQAAPAARTVVISGQVLLQDGSPAGAVRIAAITAPPPNIRPADGQNYYASQAPVATTLTDEQGRYRLQNVPPGRYYIVAGIIGHATFYPGTADIDASTIITPAAGDTLERHDIRMQTDAGMRVRGRISPPPADDALERAVLSGVTVGDLFDVVVREDGTFDFGRLPQGEYFLSMIPHAPGTTFLPFRVEKTDVPVLEFKRPPTLPVSGRIVVDRGPLPYALLGFMTERDYVTAPIQSDLTFTARLHDALYRPDMGGMPVGYSVTSVRMGSQNVAASGFQVSAAAKTGLVISVAAPPDLPRLIGQVTGAPPNSRVIATGPIIGSIEARVRVDGTFEFSPVPPGLYRLRVFEMPSIPETEVVVEYKSGGTIRLAPR